MSPTVLWIRLAIVVAFFMLCLLALAALGHLLFGTSYKLVGAAALVGLVVGGVRIAWNEKMASR